MARPNSPNVPHDMWICGKCKNGNLVALTNNRCPVCGHEKDGCRTGPGEPYPRATGLFPGYRDYQYPNTRAALPYYPASVFTYQGYCKSSPNASGHQHTPFNQHPTPPSDLWTCSECGAENVDWCDQCPVCGRGTRNSPCYHHFRSSTAYYNSPDAFPGYTSFGAAGSTADGSWYCTNCGSANSALNDYCADPDCGAAKS